jgi:DNA processing protein
VNEITDYSTTAQILALCRYGGVGPRLFDALFSHFGSLRGILEADRGSLLALPGMTGEVAGKVTRSAGSLPAAEEYVKELGQRGINVRTKFDPDFPALLFELNDPPPLLYVRGRLPDPARKSVALVGTSHAGTDGLEMTTRLARTFAENRIQIISTLRGGVDSAAHLGCRAAGGLSFAVLESGFDAVIGSDMVPLAIDIAETGGVISEYRPDQAGARETVEESNRLLVGLSQGVVVTEFYKDSPRTLDLLSFCRMIGKLAFVMVDPEKGAFADEESLSKASEYGVIPIEGYEKVDDIMKSLL